MIVFFLYLFYYQNQILFVFLLRFFYLGFDFIFDYILCLVKF